MRIVIGGEDEVAFRLAERLMVDHEVHFICPERGLHESRLARMDVNPVFGLITSATALGEARVQDADLFIGCGIADERNLVGCVSAKSLGAKRTVCFLFTRALPIQDGEEDPLTRTLGIDVLVRPSQLLTEEILRIIAVPGALDVEVFVGGRVHLLRHPVEEGAPLSAGPLASVGVPEGVVFVMARRGEEVFIPTGATHFQAGDKVTAMGNMAGINHLLFRYLRKGPAKPMDHKATVVGGGTVGLGIVQGLEDAGWRVKVIESNRKRCEEIAELVHGLVLHGDGTDLDLLASEQIGESPVLVAVTSNDEKNLLVSLLAKSLGVERIVTRADQISNERLFEQVGIDVVRSARGAAVNSVLAHVGAASKELLAELEHGEAEVIELSLPKDLPSIPLVRMKAQLFGIIGAILRRGRVIIPRGSDSVQGGDRLLVFCTKEEEENVRDFFANRLRDLAVGAAD